MAQSEWLDYFWNREENTLTELGAASLSILSILLFWLFIIWFFGGYGRKATTHTRAESERARQKAIKWCKQGKDIPPHDCPPDWLKESSETSSTSKQSQ